jgi:prepilin-type N-terminal cleavage/methylation domain-containing protein
MIVIGQVHPRATPVEASFRREVFSATGGARATHRGTVRPCHHEHGFTLVELIMAIVLAGILTAVAIVGLNGFSNTGNKSQCSTLVGAARSAAATYYANTGAYPATTGASPIGFDALMTSTPSSPAVLTLPAGVNHSGNVMSTSQWSVTMSGGGPNVPNTFANTSGGAPCP